MRNMSGFRIHEEHVDVQDPSMNRESRGCSSELIKHGVNDCRAGGRLARSCRVSEGSWGAWREEQEVICQRLVWPGEQDQMRERAAGFGSSGLGQRPAGRTGRFFPGLSPPPCHHHCLRSLGEVPVATLAGVWPLARLWAQPEPQLPLGRSSREGLGAPSGTSSPFPARRL